MEDLKQQFQELFRASGWTQAEAARRLELTRGGFNGLVTGQTTPSPATVKLFKLVLLHEKPDVLAVRGALEPQPLPPDEQELVDSLRAMNPEMRQAVMAVLKAATPRTENPIKSGLPIIRHSVADELHETAESAAPPPADADGLIHLTGDALVKELGKLHPLRAELRERSNEAGKPNARKPVRPPRVSSHPSTPPTSPVPVPTKRSSVS